jgi:hypothetical protein
VIQTDLTKANDLEKALAIRDYRESLTKPPAPEPPKETVADAPPKPAIPDPARPTPAPAPSRRPAPLPEAMFADDDAAPRPMTAAEIAQHASTLGPKPAKSGGGVGYDVMLQSIAKGEVTEINPRKIEHWGPIRAQMYGDEPFWSAIVAYPTTSMFGTINTEGMALIRGNRVIKWIYTGSGDEIP